MARSKKNGKTGMLEVIGSVLLIAVVIALVPIGLAFIPILIAVLLVIALLEKLGLKKKYVPPPREPRKLRENADKPTEHWHSAHKKRAPRAVVENLSVKQKPYALARFVSDDATGEGFYWDGRVGEDAAKLQRFGLPRLQTPEDIATWLKIPLKTLAWIGDYHRQNRTEKIAKKQHYHYALIKKSSGGERLIEAPKPILKTIQQRILREILDRVPAHPAAHGCVKGHSIKTNAAMHAGKYMVLKVDLENFFPKVRFRRVVTVFRGIGYGKEAARWLALLCTNRVPHSIKVPRELAETLAERHLPQGAPTSPALANLAAYPLDVRLNGLAKKFGVNYTRYVDDMTFSGDVKFMQGKSINYLIRYIRGIIRDERFTWNGSKKKIIRSGHRQIVTGLTVNEKPNVSRKEFDRLKATLNNCARKGPASQNRDKHDNFRAHLQGRIAFVAGVNAEKAARLEKIFERISWG